MVECRQKNVLFTGNLPNVTDPSLDTSLSELEMLSITLLVKNWQRGVPVGTRTSHNKLSRYYTNTTQHTTKKKKDVSKNVLMK
jgi:hypothetical protein